MRLGEYGLGNRVSGRAASIPGDETGANLVLSYNQTWSLDAVRSIGAHPGYEFAHREQVLTNIKWQYAELILEDRT